MPSRPYGSNILITGASSGIGLATLRLFCGHGYQVWAVSRTPLSAEDFPETVHFTSMDVTDDDSVSRKIASIWNEATVLTGDGIGTIIHCAGYGIGGAAEDTPLDAVRSQLETNYFGVLRVNAELLPLMRQRGPSMVVVLGSIAGRISIPFQSHYSASKYALEAYIEALRIEGYPHGIRASIVEAGDTRTAFTRKRVMAIPSDSPYTAEAQRAIGKMEKDEQSGYPPEKVARIVYTVATKRNPPVRSVVGTSYKLLMFAKRLLPDRFVQWILGRMYTGR